MTSTNGTRHVVGRPWPLVLGSVFAFAASGVAATDVVALDRASPKKPAVQSEASNKTNAEPAPRALGPVVISGDVGRLEVGFGLQIRATVDADLGEPLLAPATALHIRRARLFLRGWFLPGLLGDRIRFKLQLDFAPRALELIDVFGEGRVTSFAMVRAGVAKIPFTTHWDQGFLELAFVDWPTTTRVFGGGRQTGITVYDPRDLPLQYAIGVYTGESMRASNGAGLPTLYGDTAVNHGSLNQYVPLGVPHPEFVGRLRLTTGPLVVAASATWDMRPVYTVDEVFRTAVDGQLAFGPVRVWGAAFLNAAFDHDDTLMLSHVGTLVEASYAFVPQVEVALRHSVVGRTNALRIDARAYAKSQLETAAPGADTAVVVAKYANVDRIASEHESVAALNVYFVGNALRWSTDIAWLHRAPINENEIRFRSQLQLSF